MGRVDTKVVIVTGASRGIGEAIARRLVAEGAKVIMTGRSPNADTEALVGELGANVRFLQQDVSKEADWQRVVSEAEAAFGPVSVLVNNAGVSGYSDLETLEEAEYRRVIDIDQVAVFLGMKSVIPSMKRAGGGSIINIGSGAGIVGQPRMLAYVASKFAVRGMTKSAAIELAPFNIRVNSVHPGPIRTLMLSSSPTAKKNPAAQIAIPAARAGEPDEVANVVVLLASDECCFATGAEFAIDGGMTCQ